MRRAAVTGYYAQPSSHEPTDCPGHERRLVSAAVRCAVAVGEAMMAIAVRAVRRRVSQPRRLSRTGADAFVSQGSDRPIVTNLVSLIYELLDAHVDTAYLAAELPDDPCWAAHLDYLRALQRTAREMVAHISA